MAAPLVEVVEHLVSGIVEHPDDVEVRAKQTRRGDLFEVRVNPSDLGKVIGRQGRTATAIRRCCARRSNSAARTWRMPTSGSSLARTRLTIWCTVG